MSAEPREYPRFMYHPDYEPLLVQSAEEEAELDGWFDNPADFGLYTAPSSDQVKFVPKKAE